ncbi:MAG: DEAD/DEAH box helicase, partial [Mycobacteriales bacterium]
MTRPAERSDSRGRSRHPALDAFAGGYPFALDPFQRSACEALEDGRGVLVAAPTGAGKTVVGEFGVHLALRLGRKCFYTTPIKALSNQKYADLVARHGSHNVGLLTGDNSVNGDAAVVVMTTEVLRNMLYVGSAGLHNLGFVVMDEVHYLADRFRGAVWEEVIIHLPESVTLVSLSATVSNAEEFGEWLVTVRGDTAVIVEEHRPVPLSQHMLVGRRLFDLFDPGAEREVNPDLRRFIREQDRHAGRGPRRGRPPRGRHAGPSRATVIERLDREGLLPAITFIFSRIGCDAAVAQCLRAGLRLTTQPEQDEIRRFAQAQTAGISDDDLRVLGYWEWLEALQRGIAAHHAGLLPTFKETVERLFVRGLIKAVFATETLALGINMPARSVVLEKLTKWNGEAHADVTAGEYTQLTGRAGRRGIDVEGHAVVVWSDGLDPRQVAGLASNRTYPLRSSFRPSYNMAVNLVGQLGRDASRLLLESSFAQFQADGAVVGLAKQVQRSVEALAGYRDAMTCDLGDFREYAGLRTKIKAREAAQARSGAALRRAAASESLEQLKVGDVIRIPSGKHAGLAVVLDPGRQSLGDARPLVVTDARWAGRLSTADFTTPVEAFASVKVPRHFNPRSPQARRDMASSLRSAVAHVDTAGRGRPARPRADDSGLPELRAQLRAHACHQCPDREEHARWSERYERLRRETDGLERKIERRTNNLARVFDRVCALLETFGYLDGEIVTPAGQQLARIWSESDLLVAECLRTAIWAELEPAELAAAVSALVYEARRPEDVSIRVPAGAVQDALAATVALWTQLEEAERDHDLELTRKPDAGFAWAAYHWASGESLQRVLGSLEGGDLSAGDFVRWCKQLLDLLDQITKVSGESQLGATARAAGQAVRRDVVAYS